MTFLTSWVFWLIFILGLAAIGTIVFMMTVISRVILNVFLNLPIEADPFRNEEGILQYSVNIKTRDGISIKGFFIPGKEAQGRTVVFCHEIGAGAASYQKYAAYLVEKGFNLFTFDFRGHGLSGNRQGYEPRQWVTSCEMNDLNAVLDYLKTRRDVDQNRVGLFGISKGAGTALIIAGKKKNIKAVVSDGGFSTRMTLVDYMRKWTSIYLPVDTLPTSIYWLIEVWSLWVLSRRIKCHFPKLERAIPRLDQIPILMIHGKKDNYINPKQAERIYARVRGPKEIWLVPQARHNESVVVEPVEYANRVTAFFEKNL